MISNTDVLAALHRCGAGVSVQNVRDELPEHIESGIISTRLCRLRDKGFCISELMDGRNLWTLTNKGLAELSPAPAPEPAPESEPTPELAPAVVLDSEPEFASQLEYDPDGGADTAPDPLAHELLEAMELENDLEQIIWRLQSPKIVVTARAARVFSTYPEKEESP